MELINTYTAALFRRVRIPTTKEGWIAVLVCAVVLFASQWVLNKVLEGTSLEDNTKQTISKFGSYAIAFIVMLIIMI